MGLDLVRVDVGASLSNGVLYMGMCMLVIGFDLVCTLLIYTMASHAA